MVEVAGERPLEEEYKNLSHLLTRAVTPPPTEEVVGEGEDRENEQVQNEELPP